MEIIEKAAEMLEGFIALVKWRLIFHCELCKQRAVDAVCDLNKRLYCRKHSAQHFLERCLKHKYFIFIMPEGAGYENELSHVYLRKAVIRRKQKGLADKLKESYDRYNNVCTVCKNIGAALVFENIGGNLDSLLLQPPSDLLCGNCFTKKFLRILSPKNFPKLLILIPEKFKKYTIFRFDNLSNANWNALSESL